MMKCIYQFFKFRRSGDSTLCLLLMLLLCLGISETKAATFEDYPVKEVKKMKWLNGTAPGGVEVISLDWSILEQPANPMEGDSICFTFTATNLTPDTLNNVAISKGSIIAPPPMFGAASLLPNGQTNPGGNPYTGSGTYVLTGSGCSVLTAADIENGFIVCPTTAFGLTNDMPPLPFAACVDAMACFGVTLTCTDYNISLDAECETLLTPELLQINTKVPDSLLRVRIQEANGDFRPIPMVGDADVGTAVKVVIDIPGCPNVAPCWSYANIEYKLGPSQICTTDTVSCFQQVAMDDPVITFSCGPTEFVRGEVIREDLCRTSKDFMAKETITYAVRDQFGNVSDTCVQVRYIKKTKIDSSDILWPTQQTMLSCEGDLFDDNGVILPFFSGVPQLVDTTSTNPLILDTLDLTDPALPQACNLLTKFEDVIELERNCERRVIRKWNVRQWLCEGGFKDFQFFQTIILKDTTPPEIEVQADNIPLTVNEATCSALFNVPRPVVSDNCQPAETVEVEIRYPGGSNILNPDLKTISIPLGDHNLVEYIARDRCGNESRDTTYVNVVDNTTPVAICLRDMVVTITGDEARVGVDKFDEDSYDACGIDKLCVVRMDDLELLNSLDGNKDGIVRFKDFDDALLAESAVNGGCYRDYSAYAEPSSGGLLISTSTICTPEVRFCCSDVGTDVPVILRIYDLAGNFNECMVMVAVQDKSEPIVTCPTEEITISCDFEFDPNANLDAFFGTIRNGLNKIPLSIPNEFVVDSSGPLVNGTYVDNCSLGTVIEERIVDRDSICRTGSIIRKFSIVRGNDTTLYCEQLIRIVGDQNNNPLEWATFPADVEIEVVNPDDIRRIAIDYPPTVKNVGCSLIGIGHRDQYFTPSEGEFCTKIVRTWEVIDWCRNPTGRVELDSIQYIFVIDNEAPEVTFNTPINIPEPLPGDAVELVATATDNVIVDPRWLDWRYEVFRGSSTTPTLKDTIRYEDFRNSSAVIRLEGLTEGSYKVNWIVSDKCMNIDTAVQTINITERRSDEQAILVGQVVFSKGGNMDEVDVFLTEDDGDYTDALLTKTDEDGGYAFDNMPLGGEYFIDPVKNDDPLNGVSTLDLILIQRHILGLKVMDDPALKIAADVNGDTRITALDLVEMRRLLLGHVESFTKKDSWSFVYEGEDLEEIASYGAPLKGSYHIDELVSDMDVTFIGIKTGDVSGDAVGHSTGLADARSQQQMSLEYSTTVENGMTVVSISVTEAMMVNGLQATWSWSDEMELSSIRGGVLPLELENYNLSDSHIGKVPMSFHSDEALSLDESDNLFTFIFDGEHKEGMDLSLISSRIANELYTDSGVSELKLAKSNADNLDPLVLWQNTPNPWSETTVIKADIPVRGEAVFRVYDLHNRLIHKENRAVDRGTQTFTISQEQIAVSGLYFYEVEIEGLISRQKMIRVN